MVPPMAMAAYLAGSDAVCCATEQFVVGEPHLKQRRRVVRPLLQIRLQFAAAQLFPEEVVRKHDV